MSYKHLSLEERHYITNSKINGKSINKISKELNRSQSSISREIFRNTGERGYRYKQANGFAIQKRKQNNAPIKLTSDVIQIIETNLKKGWSPEQITGKLKNEGNISLHHETIYRFISKNKSNGGDLYTHLRHQNKTYRKRYGNARSRSGIPNRVGIEERPEEANNRERIGDWEADTIIGHRHKGAIVTLDERVTKLRFSFPLNRRLAISVRDSIISMLTLVKAHVKSITFDNGKEFTLHEGIAKELDCDTYFAKPYHSWERGQNENANGLLRQYFPKAMELIDIPMRTVVDAVDKLNSRPRKCLGYKTPYEAFEAATGITRDIILGYALTM